MFFFKKKPPESSFTIIFLSLFLSIAFFSSAYWQNVQNQQIYQQIDNLQQQIKNLNQTVDWHYTIKKSSPAIVTVFSFMDESNINTMNINELLTEYPQAINSPIKLGSGFIYNINQGQIITAKHVAEKKSSTFYVKLSNQKILKAKIIKQNDNISLLEVEDKLALKNLLALKISDTLPQLGQNILFINNYQSFSSSLSSSFSPQIYLGIINNLGINLTIPLPLKNLFQVNLMLNEGNSGGPIINHQGEVIGIMVAITADKTASLATSLKDF